MTDFRTWDKKAQDLCKEAEEEEKREKEEANKALGLKEGEVEGPPVAKHKDEQKNMKQLSSEKEAMLQKLAKSEYVFENYKDGEAPPPKAEEKAEDGAAKDAANGGSNGHAGTSNGSSATNGSTTNGSNGSTNGHAVVTTSAPSSLTASGSRKEIEIQGEEKCVKIRGCENTNFRIKGKSLKVVIETSKNCDVIVEIDVHTSSGEVNRCENCHLRLMGSMQSVQVDGSQGISLEWDHELNFNFVVHQKCEPITLTVEGHELPKPVLLNFKHEPEPCQKLTLDERFQYLTHWAEIAGQRQLVNRVVMRDREKEFPTFLGTDMGKKIKEDNTRLGAVAQPVTEVDPELEAAKKKEEGNEAFRANDFFQAASFYTMSLEAKKDPVVLGNRAQCWLKVGNFDKCIEDCVEGLGVDNKLPKLWFRKGTALHAQEKYMEALEAYGHAERLDPKNKQIKDAIGMSSLKHRMVEEKKSKDAKKVCY